MTHAHLPFAAALAAALGLAAPVAAQRPDSAAANAGDPAPSQAVATAPAITRYTLIDVGGKALPVRVEKEWRCQEDVTAGTLLLREDGRWRLETTKRETCGSRTRMDQDDEDGTYHAQGADIQFLDDDGDRNHADWTLTGEIDLDELDKGTLADNGVLTVRLADGKTVLRFRREGV